MITYSTDIPNSERTPKICCLSGAVLHPSYSHQHSSSTHVNVLLNFFTPTTFQFGSIPLVNTPFKHYSIMSLLENRLSNRLKLTAI